MKLLRVEGNTTMRSKAKPRGAIVTLPLKEPDGHL